MSSAIRVPSAPAKPVQPKPMPSVANKTPTKADRHDAICKKLNDTYIAKNHDYGDSFSETFRRLGIISAVTRITDKTNRLQSLCMKDAQVVDESLRDTLLDLANYAIMTVMALDDPTPAHDQSV